MRNNRTIFWGFGLLFIVTLVVTLLLPINQTSTTMYHLTSVAYRLLVVTVLLLYAVVWWAAGMGYVELRRYAKLLTLSIEGRAFRDISRGAGVFAWGFIVESIISLALNSLTVSHTEWVPAKVIITNNSTLGVDLIAFTLLADGVARLVSQTRTPPSTVLRRLFILLAVVVGVFFVRFVIHNVLANDNPYYVPLYPVLVTIVIPYLYMWIIGFMAVGALRLYARTVSGILYRGALRQLSDGISVILLATIALEFLRTVFISKQSSLSVVLLVIYGLLLSQAVGFSLIARAARQLRWIEEI